MNVDITLAAHHVDTGEVLLK